MFNSVNVVTDDLFSSAQCLHNIDIYKISFLTVRKRWIYGMKPDSFHSVFFVLVWVGYWLALLYYSKFIAMHAHASASAKAWWCFVRSYPKYADTVGSLWLGRMLPNLRRAALQVQ